MIVVPFPTSLSTWTVPSWACTMVLDDGETEAGAAELRLRALSTR